MIFIIVAPSNPLGTWFLQTWICIMPESFHANLSFPSPIVLESKICDYPTFEEDLPLFE
jgi:hypothetical protein